ALIIPVFPGSIGVLVHSGVVQPQLAFTSESMIGALPVLVNTNSVDTGVPCGIFPKLWVSSLNFNTPCPKLAPNATRKKMGIKISFRSEEHTSELQSRENLVCRLLLEKKKK